MDRLKNFGFLLKETSRRYVLRFEQRAAELSLTLTQCKALAQLQRNEGISQARLAELTDVEPMAMVRILDRMETEALIERRPDPADRRARQLFLTPKATPLLEQIWHLAELTREELFAGVSKSERDVFMRLLERVHGNVCALDGQPVAPIGTLPELVARRAPAKLARANLAAPITGATPTVRP